MGLSRFWVPSFVARRRSQKIGGSWDFFSFLLCHFFCGPANPVPENLQYQAVEMRKCTFGIKRRSGFWPVLSAVSYLPSSPASNANLSLRRRLPSQKREDRSTLSPPPKISDNFLRLLFSVRFPHFAALLSPGVSHSFYFSSKQKEIVALFFPFHPFLWESVKGSERVK